MKSITEKQRKLFELEITEIMETATSDTFARCILESKDRTSGNTLMADVIQGILNMQNNEVYFNDNNIRFILGKEISKRLGLDM